jgi:hypothetical protein
MKITLWHNDGEIRTVDLVGPLRVIPHPTGTFDVLHDEGTGWDYWFNKDGSFDGTGMSAADLTLEEAKGIMQGLKEMHEGKTKPFRQIQEELKGKKRVN